jgi:type IV fimbrial biogenesis protein FimT
MRAQPRYATGVTLIELMIVLSIIAVLTTMALPAFGNLLQSSASRSARSALSVSINQARIGAAMRSRQVVVCPSANQGDCAHDLRWQHGWISFIDNNMNGEQTTRKSLASPRHSRRASPSSAPAGGTGSATRPTAAPTAATSP